MRNATRSFMLALAAISAVGITCLGVTGCSKTPEPAQGQPAPVAASQPSANPSPPLPPGSDENKIAVGVERALMLVRQLGGKLEEDPNLPGKP